MNLPQPTFIGLTTQEISEYVQTLGCPAWRGKQIAEHIYTHGELNFKGMLNLPKELREKLAEDVQICPIKVEKHFQSEDSVDKLLVHNGDKQLYECVLLPYENRVSCCISSQVGCPMGCKFCATGLGGFDRNLTAEEIVAQVVLLQQLSKRKISHIVFMGMGEPLLNLKNILRALQIFKSEMGFNLRNITISTVGLVPQILELAEEKLPVKLALSLHSSLDEIRGKLMPVNQKWPVQEVIHAMRKYYRNTGHYKNSYGRKITIEYLLIDQVNDSFEEAKELARLLFGVPSVVNLIPFNYVDTEQGFRRPSNKRIKSFRESLEYHGLQVTQRVERGHGIQAACGQLAGEHTGKFAKRNLAPLPVS